MPDTPQNFIPRALRFKPELEQLLITDQQWIRIELLFIKERRKSLNHSFLLRAVSEATSFDYDELIKRLAVRQQPHRSAKPSFNDSAETAASRPVNFRWKDSSSTSLVSDSAELAEALKDTGVKFRKLSKTTSHTHGCRETFESPRGGHYRPLISKEGHRLFDKGTPVQSKAVLSPSKQEEKPLSLHYDKPEPIQFRATEKKYTQRQNKKRRTAQRTLTGASCRDVFMACGDTMAVSMKGNKFHWSHMVGHMLGGAASAQNLLPATAESNYTTLHLVEEYIAEILSSKECDYVDIEVTPYYSDNSIIPSELIFELSWQKLDEANELVDQLEVIHISPRSHRPLSRSNLDSIRAFRKLKWSNENEEQEENEENDGLTL